MSRPTPLRVAALIGASTLALGLIACSDDEGEALSADACDAYAGLSTVFLGDPAAATETLDGFVAAVPEGLRADAETVSSAIQASMTEEESDAMSSEDYVEASDRIGDAVLDDCDVEETVEVSGVDFAFDGIPTELPAGRSAITFTNESDAGEPHEMVVVRRNEGTTEPVMDLLVLAPEELFSKVTPTGLVFVEHADESAVTLLDLEPGQYVVVCMIPVGGEGAPHAMEGMTAEFTVA